MVGVTSFGATLRLVTLLEAFGVFVVDLVGFPLLLIKSPIASESPVFLSGVGVMTVEVLGGVWVAFKGLVGSVAVVVRACPSGAAIGVLGLVKTPMPAPCSFAGVVLLGMVGGDELLVYSGAFGSVLPCWVFRMFLLDLSRNGPLLIAK